MTPLSPALLQACFRSSPPSCQTCSSTMQDHAGEVLRFVGGVGLFFSFTEVRNRMQVTRFYKRGLLKSGLSPQVFGVWLAHRYRNTKDPRSNPGAFL